MSSSRNNPVTRPGYGRGRKPKNAGKTYPVIVLSHEEGQRLVHACGGGS